MEIKVEVSESQWTAYNTNTFMVGACKEEQGGMEGDRTILNINGRTNRIQLLTYLCTVNCLY